MYLMYYVSIMLLLLACHLIRIVCLCSGNAEETSRRWIFSSLKIVIGLRRMLPLLLVRTLGGVNGCKFIIYKLLTFRLCVLFLILSNFFRMRQQNTSGNGKEQSLATERDHHSKTEMDNRDRHRDSSSTWIIVLLVLFRLC